jgi:hypothetical protein
MENQNWDGIQNFRHSLAPRSLLFEGQQILTRGGTGGSQLVDDAGRRPHGKSHGFLLSGA